LTLRELRVRAVRVPMKEPPLAVENGLANVAGTLGSGVAWNESAVERFAV
jgi:hypothetical protein